MSGLDVSLTDAYGDAVQLAIAETDLPESTFPTECPWTFERFMAEDFWPENERH